MQRAGVRVLNMVREIGIHKKAKPGHRITHAFPTLLHRRRTVIKAGAFVLDALAQLGLDAGDFLAKRLE